MSSLVVGSSSSNQVFSSSCLLISMPSCHHVSTFSKSPRHLVIQSSCLPVFLSSRLPVSTVFMSPRLLVFSSPSLPVFMSPRLHVSQSPQSSNLDFNSSTPNLIHSSTYPLINYPYFVFNILEHKLVLDVHINKFCY